MTSSRNTCSQVLCGIAALKNQRNLRKISKAKSFHDVVGWIWLWVFSWEYREFYRTAIFQNTFSQPAFTCSKLIIETLGQGVKYVQSTIRTPERCHWCRSGVFIVNFEHISHLVLVLLLLTLKM